MRWTLQSFSKPSQPSINRWYRWAL